MLETELNTQAGMPQSSSSAANLDAGKPLSNQGLPCDTQLHDAASLWPSPKVLLVDDNPTNLKVLMEALRGQGWTTLVADDGESALEQIAYTPPHLVLLDVMMPGMDGFETCRRLKADATTAAIPVIFMTALSDTVDKVRGLELGAVDYITKPFQQEEVIARVKLHLKLTYLAQTLEQQVEARTQELSQSVQRLQQTQLQLIQSEKMSTLGQLIAGIGHEINNPINFITGNLACVGGYMQDLLELVTRYQETVPNPDPAITDLIEDIDLAYLTEDASKLMQSMQDGIVRLKDISLSLRTFARSDIMTNRVEFQIHEGIDSTLLLLKHRTKADEHRPEIQIIKEYGALPPILCYPGQLNQVFMNIIANAIDAIDELNGTRSYEEARRQPSQITIRSEVHAAGDRITLSIRDNAGGMPPAVQAHIFEPTFTTKAVGKGTGLGLPISHQIVVDKHQGHLQCDSEPGTGTEFVITLPIA
jgi:signal transduction histidine kinase